MAGTKQEEEKADKPTETVDDKENPDKQMTTTGHTLVFALTALQPVVTRIILEHLKTSLPNNNAIKQQKSSITSSLQILSLHT